VWPAGLVVVIVWPAGLVVVIVWPAGLVVGMSDSSEFNSWPFCYQLTPQASCLHACASVAVQYKLLSVKRR